MGRCRKRFVMEFIKYEVEGAVATITIDRQKALNALNSQEIGRASCRERV